MIQKGFEIKRRENEKTRVIVGNVDEIRVI